DGHPPGHDAGDLWRRRRHHRRARPDAPARQPVVQRQHDRPDHLHNDCAHTDRSGSGSLFRARPPGNASRPDGRAQIRMIRLRIVDCGLWNQELSSELDDASQQIKLRSKFDNPQSAIRNSKGIIMKSLFQDMRYALRMIFKAPSLTVVAVLTLALGIGANSAVFSIVNAVLLRPLPYAHPERVMMIQGVPLSLSPEFSAANIFDWRDRAPSFESLAAFNPASDGVNLTGDAEPQRVIATEVTAAYFSTLGVQPIQGRTFAPEDEQEGHARVVVLSYELWQQRFHRDGDIVGQTIRLNEVPHTVIGVAPPGVQAPASADLWLPLSLADDR